MNNNNESQSGNTWILVADRGRGRIVSRSGVTGKLSVVESFESPEGSSHVSELVSDKQGRFRVSQGPTSTSDTQSGFKRNSTARFAQQIVQKLEQGCQRKEFEALELVVAPAFLGAIRSALSPALQHMVTRSVARDLTPLSLHELTKRLAVPTQAQTKETPILQTKTMGDTLLIEVTGNLGAFTLQQIQSDAEAIVNGFETFYAVRHVVVDLARCDFFGSPGIGFFMRLWTQVRARGGSMVVCNASELERELLALTRLNELWPICDSLDEALEAVRNDICVQNNV